MAKGNNGGQRPAFGSAARKAQSRAAFAATGGTPTPTPTPTPTLSLSSAITRAEGNSGTASFTWTLTLNRNGSTASYPYTWVVAGSGANPANATDFGGAFPAGSGTFGPGETSKTIIVLATGDTVTEPDETFTLTVGATGLNTVTSTGTISNDEGVFALIADPLIAGLGASRVRQSGSGLSNTAHAQTGGVLTWLKFLDDRLKFTNWYNTSDANSNSLNGMLFANDGDAAHNMNARVPKLVSSDANIVYMELPTGNIQDTARDIVGNDTGATLTVANYTSVMKELINKIRAARPDMLVVVASLVERSTATGGPWTAGGKRTLVPGINTEMQSWCAGQTGIVYADIRSVLVDLADPNFEPFAFAVRDGTHYSPRGGYPAAQVVKAAIAPYVSATQRGSFAIEENLLPAFAGTGGVVTGLVAGSVAPTGYTISRFGSTNNAAVTTSVVTQNGKTFTRFLIDTTAMGSTDLEGIQIMPTNPVTIVNGGWYVGSNYVDVKAHDAWGLTGQMSSPGASGLAGQNQGGSPITGTGGWTGQLLTMPATAYAGRVETFSGQAASTTSQPPIRIMLRKGSGGTVEILIAEPELRRVSDPNLIMYNEADTTPIVVTSSKALSFNEETSWSHQVATNKPFAKFALSGDDAAKFSITKYGVLKPLAVFDFEGQTDVGADNIYNLTITATAFSPNAGSDPAAHTITALDINDGFTDKFSRASEELSASANWTKVTTGTGVLNAVNGYVAQTGGTSSTYLAPKQGDTAQQQISFRPTVGSSNTMVVYRIVRIDANNSISLIHNASATQMTLSVTIAGVNTQYTVPLYTNLNASNIMGQYRNDAVEVWQNNVLVLNQVIGANVFAGVGTDGRSGLSTGTGNFATAFQRWNNRVAADNSANAKIALKNITPSISTGTAGAPFVTELLNKTASSEYSIAVSGPAGGTWTPDGVLLRAADTEVGTYTIVVTEAHPDAANNNRASTFTVTFS